MRALRDSLETTVRSLGVPNRPPLGAMIETPAAALSVPALARYVDFFSVGTNDLAQYTLAAGRDDPAVDRYYVDDHASIWRLLAIIVADAASTPLSLCGELAAREELIPRLLTMGFRSLSMAPPLIPAAKEQIRSLRIQPDSAAQDMPRIEPAELRAYLADGRPVTILDARSAEAWNASRVRIAGAIRLGDGGVPGDPPWPRDQLTVVYCTCPGDAGAAVVAGDLRDRGFARAAVLHGGFDAWEAAGGPVEPR